MSCAPPSSSLHCVPTHPSAVSAPRVPRRRCVRGWQAMRAASSGVYCGPLRLLAMEVYDDLNAQGTLCDLVTGAP